MALESFGRLMRRRIAPQLRDLGLHSPLEFLVCRKLTQNGALRLTDLCRALQLPASTVSQMTDRLVAEGLLRREPHPADRRSVMLAATERARALGETLRRVVTANLTTALSRLTPAELTRTTEGLRAIGRVLDDAAGPGDHGCEF